MFLIGNKIKPVYHHLHIHKLGIWVYFSHVYHWTIIPTRKPLFGKNTRCINCEWWCEPSFVCFETHAAEVHCHD